MQTARAKDALQSVVKDWKAGGLTVGFVPTMGALHEGHISLVKLALGNADRVVVSIFVNPTQFAPHEDFASYPRNEQSDLEKLKQAGAHLAYLPPEDEIYAGGRESPVVPGPAAEGLESDFRPHFFAGVVNVVHRLFDHVQADIAVFGEKDYQQLHVIREMVAAEKLPTRIIGAPIVRDEYGLALSSRNAYLSPAQLEIARKLNVLIREDGAENKLLKAGFDKVDYVERRWGRVLAAAWIGKTRLIDNISL